jgi:hypothetical protein
MVRIPTKERFLCSSSIRQLVTGTPLRLTGLVSAAALCERAPLRGLRPYPSVRVVRMVRGYSSVASVAVTELLAKAVR